MVVQIMLAGIAGRTNGDTIDFDRYVLISLFLSTYQACPEWQAKSQLTG